MHFASSTSCAAVSSDTRPIERRYSRSESRLGSTVRSISGFLRCSLFVTPAPSPLCERAGRTLGDRRRRRRDPAALLEQVDALLLQVAVQLAHLLLGDVDLFQTGRHLLDRQVAAFLTTGDQQPKLVELPDRRLVCQ